MTLVELLVTLLLMGILGAMVVSVVVGSSRVAARASTRLTTERSSQAVAALLHRDLADAVLDDVTISADAVRFPRPVGQGVACNAASGTVTVARADWWGDRAPDAGRDRLRLYRDAEGGWRDVPLDAVIAASCPDGAPGWRLVPAAPMDSVQVVRVVEPAVLRRYRSSRAEWFGLAPADGSSPMQPFAGPVLPGASRFARAGDALELTVSAAGGVRPLLLPLAASP